jgi:hypothetical protein
MLYLSLKENKHKFSWTVISLERNVLNVQVYFDEPIYISSEGHENRDILTVFFSQPNSHESSTPAEVEIPQQIDREQARLLENASFIISSTLEAVFAVSFVKTGLEGSLAQFWALLNSMQILAYIYYFNILLPPNVVTLTEKLIKIAEFEPFDLDVPYKFMFGDFYLLDQEWFSEQEPDDDKERNLARAKRTTGTPGRGFEESQEAQKEEKLNSENFQEKIAPMLSSWLLLVAFAIYTALLWMISRVFTKLKHRWLRHYYLIFWNAPLAIFLEGYLPTAH